jgi:hypothetical protein
MKYHLQTLLISSKTTIMPCEYCNQPYHKLSDCEDPRAVPLANSAITRINAFPCNFWRQYQELMKHTYPELNIVLHWISDHVDSVSKQSAACKIVAFNFEMAQSIGLTPNDIKVAIISRVKLMDKRANKNTSPEDFAACIDLLDLIRDDNIETHAAAYFKENVSGHEACIVSNNNQNA